jgi:hypothetical protein
MEHNHDKKQEDDLQLDNLTKITDDKSEHKHSEEDGTTMSIQMMMSTTTEAKKVQGGNHIRTYY